MFQTEAPMNIQSFYVFQMYFYNHTCHMYVHICMYLSGSRELEMRVLYNLKMVVKNLPANAGDAGDALLIPGLGGRHGEPTPVFLPGEFHGQRRLSG